MNHCPVANSLAAYEAEYDKQQAYLNEISRRADELIDSGDLDALVEAMTALEVDRFHKAIGVICKRNTPQSRDVATLEVRYLLTTAAARLAELQCKEEMDAAAEAIAAQRFYDQMERCEA